MSNKAMVDHLIAHCKAGIQDKREIGAAVEKKILMTAINILDKKDQKDFFNQLILQNVKPPMAPSWFTLEQLKIIESVRATFSAGQKVLVIGSVFEKFQIKNLIGQTIILREKGLSESTWEARTDSGKRVWVSESSLEEIL